ncbi:MAG: UDP-N-acetylmuramoyl-L-alanine--D-glutamate ligase [Chitinispirillaceae bacterium]
MSRKLDIQNVAPERVSVIGAAKSGIAAAKYLHSRGSKVFISEGCGHTRLEDILQSEGLSRVECEADGHSEKILESDLIILSPGVRSDLAVLAKATRMGIPVWSEMELGYKVSKAPFLAVTGSSGKSTTVSLLGSVLDSAGHESVVAGNIGLPVVSVTPGLSENAFVVAEVSSFQLETVDAFRPRVAAVLNLMKNHLDRYTDEEEYYNAKKRIARNLNQDDYLVLNMHDRRLRVWAEEFSSRTSVLYFGSQDRGGDGVFYIDGGISYRFGGSSGVLLDNVSKMKLGGKHNYENACAAAAVAVAAGVDPDRIAAGLCSFSGLPHRLEYVGQTGGIVFYNDSKSTTAESIECAVSAFDSAVHLIAGGKDKGCDFSVVLDAIRGNVKSIVLIGEAADRMFSQWKDVVEVRKARTLNEALLLSFENARSGEKVVFSPGCSSFDMFKNFEHRGEVFRKAVQDLVSEREQK